MVTNLILGDCLEKLKDLEDCSIDSIVTDPPYHLTSIVKRFGKEGSAPAKHGKDGSFSRLSKGFMGQEWDGGDIAFKEEVWKECLRVLKPGGHLLAFSGSRTYHRMAYAIDEAGFEIRDQIMWVYGSGFPKSHNISIAIDKKLGAMTHRGKAHNAYATGKNFQDRDLVDYQEMPEHEGITDEAKEWKGWGTALKPAHEPIVLARKPLDKKTVAENVLEYGTGALNIDGCRVGDEVRIDKITENGFGSNFMDDNWKPSGKCYEKEVQGRYPANFIHDGLDEEWSKYFYCPKTNKKDRNEGCEELPEKFKKQNGSHNGKVDTDDLSARWQNTAKNNHPTVKPTELMRYLVRLVTPKNGTVLDPFMGSGSTGKACMLEGFNFVGIEMSEEYLEIAKKRINFAITDNE